MARLRPAFQEAAAAHRDALSLDDEQIEQMVQKAADRADGLQWRRALASVATEQLGIGLGEALGHPAVARAQAIVGAPSYEEALSALGAEPPKPASRPEPPAEQPAQAAGDAHDEEHAEIDEDEDEEYEDDGDEEYEDDEDDEDEAPEPAMDATAPHRPVRPSTEAEGDAEAADDHAEVADGVRLRAVHLGGIANLAPAEGDLELHISSEGLDIIRGPEHSVLGRLTWGEIVALETPEPGGRFRRKRQTDAHLVVRSEQGSASFEIPGVTTHELREHLDPLLARR